MDRKSRWKLTMEDTKNTLRMLVMIMTAKTMMVMMINDDGTACIWQQGRETEGMSQNDDWWASKDFLVINIINSESRSGSKGPVQTLNIALASENKLVSLSLSVRSGCRGPWKSCRVSEAKSSNHVSMSIPCGLLAVGRPSLESLHRGLSPESGSPPRSSSTPTDDLHMGLGAGRVLRHLGTHLRVPDEGRQRRYQVWCWARQVSLFRG